MRLQDHLDKILEVYSKGNYYEEVKLAKEEFFARVGQVAEGSDKFETQMNAFLDWYLYDRPLLKSEICPVKMFVFDHLKSVSQEEHDIYHDLTKSNHSIFELLKVKEGDVYLKDLFSGEKYIVEDSDINLGFTKGDVFEGRLIRFKDKLVFGSSFVFHPTDVKSFIVKEIKKVRSLDPKTHLKLMHRLAMMRIKSEQYTHIDVRHIYTESPLF
jgi:hypothetical protein